MKKSPKLSVISCGVAACARYICGVVEVVVIYCLGVALSIEWCFYLFGVVRVLTHKDEVCQATPAVSVVICVRNEGPNLLNNLTAVLGQDYPEFEVVVVNDRSTDDTLDVLKAYKARHDRLKIVDIPDSDFLFGNKKYGLTLGIKAAKHEKLLFTDADCQPVSDQWIRTMMSSGDQKEVILGYGRYRQESGFLNRLIRFDTFLIGTQYLALGKCGAPYMGVGRNLSYTKELFFKHKGFSRHMDVRSGDDDLFVAQAANAGNTEICISLEGQTMSQPKSSFVEWFDQKRRHISTSSRYKLSRKLLLTILGLRRYLFWGGAIIGLLIFPDSSIILSLIGARLLIQLIIFHFTMRKMGEQGLLYLSPLLEIILLIIYPVFGIANAIKGPGKWKN